MRSPKTIAKPSEPVRRLLVGGMVGVLFLATLAGCGDDDTTAEGETDQTAVADTGETTGDTVDTTAETGDTGDTGGDGGSPLGPDDPADGEPVRIGLISDGATAAYDNTDELRAGEATAEWLNQHRAGIGGRPIEIVTCETGGDPAGGTDCANRMIEQDVVAVALSQSAVTGVVWETLHTGGVPAWFTQASGDELEVDEESTFVVFNPNATFFGLPAAVARGEGVEKIAFVVIDVPQAVEIIEGDGGQLLTDAGFDYDVVRVPVGTADMTSQMQQVVAGGAGVAQVIGNDAFCIAAFQGLDAVAYEGAITAISPCITDATRDAMPGGLTGINVLSTLALGAVDDPTWEQYEAVMDAYGDDVGDVNNLTSMGGYAAVASLAAALEGIEGDVTQGTVIETLKAMPEMDYPGGAGLTYRCGGSADPASPPVCTNQWLRTELDGDGNPTTYSVEDSSSLLG